MEDELADMNADFNEGKNNENEAYGNVRIALWFRAFLIRVIIASVLFLCLFLMDFIKDEVYAQAKNTIVESISSDARIEALETMAQNLIFPEKN